MAGAARRDPALLWSLDDAAAKLILRVSKAPLFILFYSPSAPGLYVSELGMSYSRKTWQKFGTWTVGLRSGYLCVDRGEGRGQKAGWRLMNHAITF